MTTTTRATESAHLADQLDRAVHGGPWHGPALLEVLAGVDASTALARPIAEAHSIWEIVEHVSTWTAVCRERISGEREGPVADEENWPSAPGDAADATAAWELALARLEERHGRLHGLVADLDDARLDDPVTGSDPTVRGLLFGLLQHHAYHAGQITVLRRAGAAS